jgi:hypothetical protein
MLRNPAIAVRGDRRMKKFHRLQAVAEFFSGNWNS